MSSITTLGVDRWLHFPESGGGNERFVANAPLGAGVVQIASSNATLGAQENNLRTLWEHPGVVDISGDLRFAGDIDSFPWDAYPGTSSPLILFAGTHRIRPFGVTGRFPRVVLKIGLASDGSSTAGAILIGATRPKRPSNYDLRDSTTTTSGTLTTKTLILSPQPRNVSTREVAPITGAYTPQPAPVEDGTDTVMSFFVGVWNGSGGKTRISALTLYLREPA